MNPKAGQVNCLRLAIGTPKSIPNIISIDPNYSVLIWNANLMEFLGYVK